MQTRAMDVAEDPQNLIERNSTPGAVPEAKDRKTQKEMKMNKNESKCTKLLEKRKRKAKELDLIHKATQQAVAAEKAELKERPYSTSQIHALFRQYEANEEPKLSSHIRGMISDQKEYLTHLKLLIDFGVSQLFSSATKARVLATVYTLDRKEAATLLDIKGMYGFADVLKTIEMLDAPRRLRQKRLKIALLEKRQEKDPKAVKHKTIGKLKTEAHHLQRDYWLGTSLNKTAVKFFKSWFGKIEKNSLEFYLLNYPVESWKPAFDSLHLKPSDLQLEYFQNVVFDEIPGNSIPESSLVSRARRVERGSLSTELKAEPRLATMFSFLRKSLRDGRPERKVFDSRVQKLCMMGFDERHAAATANHFWRRMPENSVQPDELVEWLFANKSGISAASCMIDRREITNEAKGLLAANMPLDEAIWWYHEIACPQAEAALQRRLEADKSKVAKSLQGGKQSMAYGKLMERMLYFRENKTAFTNLLLPHAEAQLKKHNITASGRRLVVAGDASGSMEVAIKSATILGSILSLVLDANLVFFNEELIRAPCQPRSAKEVLQVVETIPAKGATSMASALWPFYQGKIKLDMFVLVSDEGENQKHKGYSFAELFSKYRKEINPDAQVILVSFLPEGNRGAIRDSLYAQKIDARQYRLDPDRPDTSKFDGILGQVALACKEHRDEAEGSGMKTLDGTGTMMKEEKLEPEKESGEKEK